MSDSSANAWGIPKPDAREDGVLYMHPLYSKEFYEGLKAIEIQGVRFERAIEDEVTHDVSVKNGIFKCEKCLCTVEEDGVDFGLVNYCPDCGKFVERY